MNTELDDLGLVDLNMLQEDCNLDDIVDIDLDIDGEVKPPKNDKIALIDADTIAYTAALNSEVENEALPQEFYSEEEWAEIEPKLNEDGMYYEADVVAGLAKAKEKIDRILDKTGCRDFELHFTGGKDNFRYSIYPEYKANRKNLRTPAGLVEIKEALIKHYEGKAFMHTGWEADDIVIYKKTQDPDKYILCAIDKDVYNSIEGKHFNYYESQHYDIEMKWVETDRYTAITWPFLQTLMGDVSDNVVGLKGIGPKRAQKIIDGKMTKKDLWLAVEEAYKMQGRSAEDALLNLNLVDMHLLAEVDGELKIQLHTLEELRNGSFHNTLL